MAFTQPTVTDFKQYFVRDFPYGTDINTSVTDTDILNAITKASTTINQELFANQVSYTIGFLLLTAHLMVMSLRASSQGISGQFTWLVNSHSAGSVSESLQIPDRIMQYPAFAMLTKTTYGAQYLEMLLPSLLGVVVSVEGKTQP